MRIYVLALAVGIIFGVLVLLACAQMTVTIETCYSYAIPPKGIHKDFAQTLSWLSVHAAYLYLTPAILIVGGVWMHRLLAKGRAHKNLSEWLSSGSFANSACLLAVVLTGALLGTLITSGKRFAFLCGFIVMGAGGLFPITGLLLVIFGVACKFVPQRFEPKYRLAVIPFLIPLVTLLWGAFWFIPSNPDLTGPDLTRSEHCWQVQVLTAFFYAYIWICAELTLLYRGHQRFFVAMFANGMWYLILSLIAACMSITNVWPFV